MARPPYVDGSQSVEGELPPTADAAPSTEVAPTKAAVVLALLGREEGGTLQDMVDATGWLPHTTRAFLTGLRKKGHPIVRDKVDGVTRYSIATETAA
jgi:hypothetical protein